MKLLIDNNLSYRIKNLLLREFSICVHVSDLNMHENTQDIEIWNYSKANDYLILTKDNDFESMSRLYGCPPKVIQLMCGNKSTLQIAKILNNSLSIISDFESDNENCLLYLQ